MLGAVVSYLTVAWPLPTLPAKSRQLPATSPAGSSGPTYETLSQLAIPDAASLPVNAILTG